MSKPLLYYCGNKDDEQLLKEIEESIEKMLWQDKLDLALATLIMRVQPKGEYPIPLRLIDELSYVTQLSDDGKLDLVRALIN